jgi:hypothetical protein
MGRIHNSIAKNGFITASALPFQAIPGPAYSNTNTVLLSGGTANVSDIGGNPVTVTRTGTVSTSTNEPFTSSLNSFNIAGGAGGNYISMVNAVFSPGTGDYTFECFVNMTALTATYSVFVELGKAGDTGGRQNGILCWIATNGGIVAFHNGTNVLVTATGLITTGTWFHIALVRLDGVTKIYVDGVERASSAAMSGVNFNLGGALIGRLVDLANSTSAFNGRISNWRFVKGLAIYREGFTIPSADLAVIANSFTWSQNYGVRAL